MSKIKFGLVVVDGRGKLGGHVLAKNRAGNYIRTKVTPVNPQTTYQQSQRAQLAALSSQWSALTNSQRNDWNAAVADFQKTDIFGDLRTPTGKNLFTGLNRNRLNIGQTVLTTPPAAAAIPSLSITSVDYDITAGDMDIVTVGDATGAWVLVWGTPAMSQGTSFVKNRLRLLASFSGGSDATINAFTAYNARFAPLAVSANYRIGLQVVNAGGQAGVMVLAKGTVTP